MGVGAEVGVFWVWTRNFNGHGISTKKRARRLRRMKKSSKGSRYSHCFFYPFLFTPCYKACTIVAKAFILASSVFLGPSSPLPKKPKATLFFLTVSIAGPRASTLLLLLLPQEA